MSLSGPGSELTWAVNAGVRFGKLDISATSNQFTESLYDLVYFFETRMKTDTIEGK